MQFLKLEVSYRARMHLFLLFVPKFDECVFHPPSSSIIGLLLVSALRVLSIRPLSSDVCDRVGFTVV